MTTHAIPTPDEIDSVVFDMMKRAHALGSLLGGRSATCVPYRASCRRAGRSRSIRAAKACVQEDDATCGDVRWIVGWPAGYSVLGIAMYLLVTKALRLDGTMLSGPGAEDVQMASGEGGKKSSVSRPPQ
jgi:hypothetical protein